MATGCCRTVSTSALQALADFPPLGLEITQRALKCKVANNEDRITWHDYTYLPRNEEETQVYLEDDDVQGTRKKYVKEEKSKIRNELTKVWQEKWKNDPHGILTKRFIPTINDNDARILQKLNKYAVQLVTGYDSINSTLYDRRLEKTPYCPHCKTKLETVDHILFESLLYDELRYEELRNFELLDDLTLLVSDGDKIDKLNAYAFELFRKRRFLIENSTTLSTNTQVR